MIESLSAKNFRCFKSLELDKLRRVNVIVGQNASGKTVLLETVGMALKATPNVIPWLNQNRQTLSVFPQNPTPEQFQANFLDLFSEFNSELPIEIAIRDSSGKTATLRVHFDPKRAVTAQPQLGFQPSPALLPPPSTIVPLVFERTNFRGQSSALMATIQPQGQWFFEPGPDIGPVSEFFSSASYGAPQVNAAWFSKLSIEKRDSEIIDALRRHFPFIRGVTSETLMPGLGTVYADIPSLSRKLPLSLVSGGISRLFTLMLAIVTLRNGVVLVDEIENGLFHDQHPLMWKTITDLAIEHDTQLFVTTHSMECLRALVPLVRENEEEFCLLRTRRRDGVCEAIRIDGRNMVDGIEEGFEVR